MLRICFVQSKAGKCEHEYGYMVVIVMSSVY